MRTCLHFALFAALPFAAANAFADCTDQELLQSTVGLWDALRDDEFLIPDDAQFQALDRNGSGGVTFREFKRTLKHEQLFGEDAGLLFPIYKPCSQLLFDYIDSNDDNLIDFREFVLFKTTPPVWPE